MIIPCYKFVRVTLSFICNETCILHPPKLNSQINPLRVQLVYICQQKQDGPSLLFQRNGAHCRKEGQILMYLQTNEQ